MTPATKEAIKELEFVRHWVDSDDDDGEPKTMWYVHKCPAGNCSDKAFKRASIKSYSGPESVEMQLRYHLENSSLHMMTPEEAYDVALSAEISQHLETHGERKEYRKRMRQLKGAKACYEVEDDVDYKGGGFGKSKKGKVDDDEDSKDKGAGSSKGKSGKGKGKSSRQRSRSRSTRGSGSRGHSEGELAEAIRGMTSLVQAVVVAGGAVAEPVPQQQAMQPNAAGG